MNEPRRLKRSGGASQRLLDSASLDKPSPASRRHAVNLAATASAFSRSSAAAPPAAPKSSVKTLVTWIAIGAAASVALGVTSSALLGTSPAPRAAAPLLAPSSAAASSPDISPEPAVKAEPPARAQPVEPWIPSPAAVATGSAAEPNPASAEEVREIEAARAALKRGDTAGALAQLSLYDSVYPAGRLNAASMVLRIQALSVAGRSAEAQALSKAFAAKYPQHPALELVGRGVAK